MTGIEDVIRSLLFRRPSEPPPAGSVERLADGTFHLDHHDPDHVYLLTVREVPRVPLPVEGPTEVGEFDGVRAHLVRVALANHVEVTLDAEPGPARETASRDFAIRYEEWGRRADGDPPPPWPAERFRRLVPGLSDDTGTAYRLASGQAGGTGTEWEVRWSFLPTPPPAARRLTLRFSPGGGEALTIDVPLPR
ncbi:hypothetical protein AB0J20_03480 [Micromonospora costi]|uniref:hypothetical protein n=1 Tax=Micromonospora costi TaxID=1530042 RepID=UPI0033E51F92